MKTIAAGFLALFGIDIMYLRAAFTELLFRMPPGLRHQLELTESYQSRKGGRMPRQKKQ